MQCGDEGLLATTLVVYTAMHSDSTVFIQTIYIYTVLVVFIYIYIYCISLDYVLCKTSELHWV